MHSPPPLNRPPARARRSALVLLALWLPAGLLACAPERVDMNVHDIFTSDAARYALQTQMAPALLASVGGYLPTDVWPSDAAPLLVDLQVIAENKIDLAASGIDISPYSGLRLHWTELIVGSTSEGPLSPQPTKIELYIGP